MKKLRQPREELTVLVKGKNMSVTPALHDQVVRKMGKLQKYHDRLQAIEVELRSEKTREAASQSCVEATTHVRGRTLRVTSTHEDMHAAIDEAVDKLYRQLNRQKERLKSHHGSKLAETIPASEAESSDESSLRSETVSGNGREPHEPVVRVERLDLEPEFEEDAIEAMEDLGHDFYVFLNARNERMSVLYRRSDGGYGVIEPHAAR
jgi:putative sigma-54 modulation protein